MCYHIRVEIREVSPNKRYVGRISLEQEPSIPPGTDIAFTYTFSSRKMPKASSPSTRLSVKGLEGRLQVNSSSFEWPVYVAYRHLRHNLSLGGSQEGIFAVDLPALEDPSVYHVNGNAFRRDDLTKI